MNKVFLIKELYKRIDNASLLMKQFPSAREEYLEEALRYSQIVYELMKESVLP
jgi:hypothetical protein